MPPNRRAVSLALTAMVSPASAEPMQYADVVYDRPEGWVTMTDGWNGRAGYRTLSRRYEESCGNCLLFLTESHPPRGRYAIKGGVIRYVPPDGSTGGTDLIYRVGGDSIFIGTQPLN